MKKSKLIFCAALILCVANQAFGWEYPEVTQELPYEEGLGTEEVPYVITTAQQLANLSYFVNKGNSFEGVYFKLGNDIDLNPGVTFNPEDKESYKDARPWVPIGTSNKFKGYFNGDNHVISGLYLKGDNIEVQYDSKYIKEGLFGVIEDAELSDLTISNSLIVYVLREVDFQGVTSGFFTAESKNSNFYRLKNEGNIHVNYIGEDDSLGSMSITVSGVVGNAASSSDLKKVIEDCENKGSIKLTSDFPDSFNLAKIDCGLSGIVGSAYGVDLKGCHNQGDIDGNGVLNCAGIGIFVDGYDSQSVFENISNTGDINGGAGLFLMARADTLKDSYNTGNITNGCGLMNDCQFLNLVNCYNTGDINDIKCRGVNGSAGLVGYSDYLLNMEDCYNAGSVYSPQSAAGLIGCAGPYHIVLSGCYNTGIIESKYGSAGGIVGLAYGSGLSFENCENKGLVKGDDGCGGIVGSANWGAYISDCRNEGDINGTSKVGGIVGESHDIDISNSSNAGSISAASDEYGMSFAGGLVGACSGGSEHSITQSFNTGSVQAEGQYVGGIGGQTPLLGSCYNTGMVSGKSYVGGLSGCSPLNYESAVILNCYNIGDVSGDDFAAGLCANLNAPAKYCYNYGDVKCVSENKALLWIYGYMMLESQAASDCYSIPQDNSDISLIYIEGDNTAKKENNCETKTKEEFKNGSVCILLNGDQIPTPWGQDPEIDQYPLLNGKGNPEMGGIDSIYGHEFGNIDKIYTIDGRELVFQGKSKLCDLPSGIYIINGKKIAISH